MPLRTYQSDQAEAKAAKGGGTNPLFYLGAAGAVLGALFMLAKSRWALGLYLGLLLVVVTLGLSGRLGFMTPLWDSIGQAWPV